MAVHKVIEAPGATETSFARRDLGDAVHAASRLVDRDGHRRLVFRCTDGGGGRGDVYVVVAPARAQNHRGRDPKAWATYLHETYLGGGWHAVEQPITVEPGRGVMARRERPGNDGGGDDGGGFLDFLNGMDWGEDHT